MQKRGPMNSSRARSLILSGRNLPEITAVDETTVVRAVQTVRKRRKLQRLHDRAHSEIAAGRFSTLAAYHARRRRKAK